MHRSPQNCRRCLRLSDGGDGFLYRLHRLHRLSQVGGDGSGSGGGDGGRDRAVGLVRPTEISAIFMTMHSSSTNIIRRRVRRIRALGRPLYHNSVSVRLHATESPIVRMQRRYSDKVHDNARLSFVRAISKHNLHFFNATSNDASRTFSLFLLLNSVASLSFFRETLGQIRSERIVTPSRRTIVIIAMSEKKRALERFIWNISNLAA